VAHVRSDEVVGAVTWYWLPLQSAATFAQALSLSAALNVLSKVQAAHCRSALALPALVMPYPAGQVCHAVQEVWPALEVKVPEAQSSHTRSAEAVATALRYWPAGQVVPTAAQSVSSLTALNVLPTVQAAHCRSATALPTVNRPCPTAQVFHAVQEDWPVLEVKLPAAQSAHVRSELVVALAVVYLPAAQAALTALQAAPLAVVEKYPVWHAAHARSAVALPALVMPSPMGHVDQAAQEVWPALEVNIPAAQSAHVRSELSVAATVVYLPATQASLTAVHIVSSFVLE
jgi:hypothetical protein